MSTLTQEEVQKLFSYNPETGILTRKVKTHGHKKGSVVGSLLGGYLKFCMNYKSYLVHRIIWLHVYGKFPTGQIDHINRNKTDNRLCNLREVTHQANSINKALRSDNTSGVTGVSKHKASNKWFVRISVNKQNKYLGSFDSFEDAVKARLTAEEYLNYDKINIQSSAKQYIQS